MTNIIKILIKKNKEINFSQIQLLMEEILITIFKDLDHLFKLIKSLNNKKKINFIKLNRIN